MENLPRVYPLVSIVTINYNGVGVTCDLLNSLRKCNYRAIEVIVVDNCSSQNPDEIKVKYPEINLIKNTKNLGFAGGNNEGFKVSKGKYILMLNNDTEVDPDFLFPLVDKMEKDSMVGAVSPKLVYHDSNGIIQYAGSSCISPFTGRNKMFGHKEQDAGQYNHCAVTHYAHGAAMLFRKSILSEIGMMEDMYFLYYEELDFCERIKEGGYSIWYIGSSVVYHKESMTVGKQNPLKTYYQTRNRLVFMRRNTRGYQLMVSLLFFTLVSLPKNVIQYLLEGRIDLLKAFIKGYLWNWSNHKVRPVRTKTKLIQ